MQINQIKNKRINNNKEKRSLSQLKIYLILRKEKLNLIEEKNWLFHLK